MPTRKYRLLVENPDALPAEDSNSIRVRVRAQSNVTLSATGAPVAFTVSGEAPATDAGAYRVFGLGAHNHTL